MLLRDFERRLLQACYEQALQARRQPKPLRKAIEPTWCALLAKDEKILGSRIFPSDSEKSLLDEWAKEVASYDPKNLTLYLSFEPSPFYERRAAITEEIRALGAGKVIIGAEDPSTRVRGKGIEALRKQGIEVILANSEEARRCQLLYEDYGKVMNKSLPMLRIVWDLDPKPTGEYELNFHTLDAPVYSDALLLRSEMLNKKPLDFTEHLSEGQWFVVLDANAQMDLKSDFVVKNGHRIILFLQQDSVPETYLQLASSLGVQVLRADRRGDLLDLAVVLRSLRDLGLFSLICRGDWTLFFHLIRSGLVDSVYSQVEGEVTETLAKISQAIICCRAWDDRLTIVSPRVLSRSSEKVWVESELRFATLN